MSDIDIPAIARAVAAELKKVEPRDEPKTAIEEVECPSCGHKLTSEVAHCPGCGAALEWE